MYLKTGTLVRLRTTNGGEIIARLGAPYRPTYHAVFDYVDEGWRKTGEGFIVGPERIKSVEAIEG